MLRTSEEYRDRLYQMKPNVYIGGQKVGRDDPRLEPGIRVMNITFDLAWDARYKGVFTARSKIASEEINRWAHLPSNARDLMQKQKMIRIGARRAGG
jgi:aromatic ring hydroxylase